MHLVTPPPSPPPPPVPPASAGAGQGRAGFWPGILVGLLVMQLAMSGLVFYLANSDRTFAIEPDYYAKALGWDTTRAQGRAAAALGWSADVTVTPGRNDDERRHEHELCVKLTNAAGAPLRTAVVAAEVFHHRNARQRQALVLSEQQPGDYRATVTLDPPGVWEIRVQAACAGQMLRSTRLIDVAGEEHEAGRENAAGGE